MDTISLEDKYLVPFFSRMSKWKRVWAFSIRPWHLLRTDAADLSMYPMSPDRQCRMIIKV